jgi:hypothetical protein
MTTKGKRINHGGWKTWTIYFPSFLPVRGVQIDYAPLKTDSFTFFSVLNSPHNPVVTCACAARSGRCVQVVPHNAHVGRRAEGRSLLLHCLRTSCPSIEQPAFRDQIMMSKDISGPLFKTEINSLSQCENLMLVRKFTSLRISYKFLAYFTLN